LDFGLAKLSLAEGVNVFAMLTVTEDDALTSPGGIVGTVAYMSPEQARGEELDARTHLFSLGAVLSEMTTGQMAFPGHSAAIIHDAILNRTPVSVTLAKPNAPIELERVINKALEKDRSLRYQHASDVSTDLKRVRRDIVSNAEGHGLAQRNAAGNFGWQGVVAAMGGCVCHHCGAFGYHADLAPKIPGASAQSSRNFAINE
jgi:serine/threonine protein kinase